MSDVAVDTLPTTVADAGHPWNRLGSDTSSTHHDDERPSFKQRVRVWQKQVGEIVESRRMHLLVLFLVSCDAPAIIIVIP
jgi:hypothetical protein